MNHALFDIRLPAWEELPDFGLYMDQLTAYAARVYPALSDEHGAVLTPSMINNYVKLGLMERPQHKKYSANAIAQVLMICLLKQTADMETMRLLLRPDDRAGTEGLYRLFRASQETLFSQAASRAEAPDPLVSALQSSVWQLVCRDALAHKADAER